MTGPAEMEAEANSDPVVTGPAEINPEADPSAASEPTATGAAEANPDVISEPDADPAAAEHRVVFTPAGTTVSAPAGTTVLDAARSGGVDLDSVCGGRGLCGRCQVAPVLGEMAKWGVVARADALSEPGPTEIGYRGRRPMAPGHRLGCQAAVRGDAVIDVPPQSQVHRPVVRKDIDLGPVTVDPIVTLHYLELPEPELGAETAVAEALAAGLRSEWGLESAAVEVSALSRLQAAAGAGGGAVTAAVHDRARVIDVRPGYSDQAYGLAFDVGSTTIAGYLLDLATGAVAATEGLMNPQIRFGEDLMSRVSYAMANPGGAAELTAAVRAALNELAGGLCRAAGADPDCVHDVVVVGNPVMHHLVLGLDPSPLGAAPFTLAVSEAVNGAAADIGLDLPRARLYAGPCIAGHVGADAAAAVLAAGPHRSADRRLVVDVGTNAEIVLSDRGRLLAASSPTGPAFEGAQTSCGRRAAPGAIERVRINPATAEPRFKVIGCDLWSDEAGFAEASAGLEVSGLCGSGIVEAIAQMFLAGIIDSGGVIQGGLAERTPRVAPDGRTFSYVLASAPVPISVTQNDVRAIQLAKAALRAGIDLLMDRAGVAELDGIALAGAFGAHIDPVHAMVLGLIPDIPAESVRAVGNAAGAGAARMLVSRRQRAEIEGVVRSVTKIETATEERFQELFVAALAIPHSTAATPHLASLVDLPEPPEPARSGPRRRRRNPTARDIEHRRNERDMSIETTGIEKMRARP